MRVAVVCGNETCMVCEWGNPKCLSMLPCRLLCLVDLSRYAIYMDGLPVQLESYEGTVLLDVHQSRPY